MTGYNSMLDVKCNCAKSSCRKAGNTRPLLVGLTILPSFTRCSLQVPVPFTADFSNVHLLDTYMLTKYKQDVE